MSRRTTALGQLRRDARAPTASSSSPTLAALGADLLHHWEPSDATVTLNGSNASQLDDRVSSGAKHLTQATAGNQPAYDSTGGPNGRPCITLQDTGRRIEHTTLGITAGKRLGVYWIGYLPGGTTTYQFGSLYTASGGTAVATYYQALSGGVGKYGAAAKPNGAAAQNNNLNTPALAAGWAKHSTEFLASGLVGQINGGAISPAFTGTGTADLADYASIGSWAGISGGKCALYLIVDNIDSAKRAIVDAYTAYWFGL